MAKNKPPQDDMVTGWDARQGYTYIMCDLAFSASKASYHNPKEWFEKLQDFYDWVACIIDPKFDKYIEDLKEIEVLLYGSKVNGKYKNKEDRKSAMEKSYSKMRHIFRRIMKDLWDKDMYVPKFEKPNLSDSVLQVR